MQRFNLFLINLATGILLVFIPAVSHAYAAIDSPLATASKQATQRLNLNQASVEQLTALPGIGRSKAEAIVAYRELNGKFVAIEQLSEVKGIGEKLLAKIASKISVQ